MKRNLLALFLAVVMMTSLVLMAAPVAKAAENDPLEFYEGEEVVITKDTYLDLNGKNLTVTVQDGATLYVIDSANYKDISGNNSGKLTVKQGANNIALSTTDASNNMRYLKIDNGDGTYSFHPFYLTVDKYGVNFKKDAVCVRGIFLASNKVKELITSERGDYGFVVDEDETKTASAKSYAFTKNGVEAYGDLVGSFDSEKVETSHKIGAYICVDGEYIFSTQAPKINPSVVLKTVNAQFAGVSSTNKDRIKYLAERHPHLATYLNNLETENVLSESTITFDDTAKRSSFSTTEQVWEENGITVTNKKDNATSSIADNSNPIRFYKESTITIAYPKMSAITIESVSNYADGFKDASVTNATVKRVGTTITITFNAPTDSITLDLTEGQFRVNKITITAGSGEQCDHNSATEATCETPKFCDDCGAIMEDAKSHTGGIPTCTDAGICTECGVAYLPMVEHNDDNDDGACDTCTWNIRKVTVKSTVPVATKTASVTIKDYATANGWANGTQYNSLTMGDGDITVTTNGGGNTGKYYTSGNEWRTYQSESATITVSAAEGVTITSVKITYSVSNTGILTHNGKQITSGTVVAVDSDSVTFGVGNTGSATNGQVKITAIDVVYERCDHQPLTEATCTEKAVCKICTKEYGPEPSHKYDDGEITTAATCTTKGVKTFTCSVCRHSYTEEINALGHNFVNGKCNRENCDATESTGGESKEFEVKFALGADGSQSHADGNSKTSYTETVDGYTLNITSGSNMYTGARDAKGNSCIKIGTSSNTGKFSFTVGENVTSVTIYVAKYKSNTSKVTINGTTYTLTKNSNNGEYDAITIDTTTTKTINFASASGGVRCMINSIEFKGVAK